MSFLAYECVYSIIFDATNIYMAYVSTFGHEKHIVIASSPGAKISFSLRFAPIPKRDKGRKNASSPIKWHVVITPKQNKT